MAPHQSLITDSSDFNQELEKRSKENLYDLEHYIKKQEKNNHLNLDINNLILIGHSNGGDMSMMFATLYPERVSKVVSLDRKRYPFPRNPKLEILRFGAIDDEPDEGVVPESGVQVIYVKGARHMDLCDRGSQKMKDKIQKSMIQFLDR
jgi:predicted esterase